MTEHLTHEERQDLSRTIFRILDNWGIDAKDQISLLGLPADTRSRSLAKYTRGTPLPEEQETHWRISKLLTIQTCLDTAFPHNVAMANYWVTTENTSLNNRTPLQVMLERGIEGIDAVVSQLDYSAY